MGRALVLRLAALAWAQELPTGPGLAAGYPGDLSISEHPEVRCS